MSAEEQLRRLAEGPGWMNPLVQQRARESLKYALEVQKALGNIPTGWESQASSAAQSHLRALAESLKNAAEWLKALGSTVTEANSTVQIQAAEALAGLPAGDVPGRIVDAVKRGDASVMTPVGAIALSGIAAPFMINHLNSIYANRREEEAAKALEALRKVAQTAGNSYRARIAVGFDIVKPAPVEMESKRSSWPSGVMGTGVGVNAGVGIAGGVGSGLGRVPSPGSNFGLANLPTGTPSSPGVGQPRPNPPYPERPSTGTETGGRPPGDDGTGNPGTTRPGIDGDGGVYRPDSHGPSVDSGLGDGQSALGMRSGLGAAGLGAVGLAAGTKLASGASGAGGLGGLGLGGVGVGGVGTGAGASGAGGLAGTTGTSAGSGSASSNAASGSAKGAAGARPGMMMGGQGGTSSDKASGPNRLGYVAPKFEDDYEENIPHPASRAGRRGE